MTTVILCITQICVKYIGHLCFQLSRVYMPKQCSYIVDFRIFFAFTLFANYFRIFINSVIEGWKGGEGNFGFQGKARVLSYKNAGTCEQLLSILNFTNTLRIYIGSTYWIFISSMCICIFFPLSRTLVITCLPWAT